MFVSEGALLGLNGHPLGKLNGCKGDLIVITGGGLKVSRGAL